MGKYHTPLSTVFIFLLGLQMVLTRVKILRLKFHVQPQASGERGRWAHEGLYVLALRISYQSKLQGPLAFRPAYTRGTSGSFKITAWFPPPPLCPECDVIHLEGAAELEMP